MRIRICPYCDSEMKKSHYCDECNSFVWRPEYEDIHLNAESRGLGEEDCAYGENHDEKDHNLSDLKKRLKEERAGWAEYTKAKTGTQQNTIRPETRKAVSEEDQKKGSAFAVIIVIIVICSVVGFVLPWLSIFLGDITEIEPENIIENILDNDSDGDIEYLDDEQLAELTDACTCYDHLDMTWEQMEQIIEEWHDEYYSDDEMEIEENAYSDDYVAYYTGHEEYNLERQDNITIGDIYIEVNYDSVSGQLHYISVYETYVDDAQYLIDKIVAKLSNIYGYDEGQVSLEDELADVDYPEEYEFEDVLQHIVVYGDITDETVTYLNIAAE